MASKYQPLEHFLRLRSDVRVRLSFAEIEQIVGFPLPRSARQYAPWWANVGGSHVQAQSWLCAGWRTRDVDVAGGKVTFERSEPGTRMAGATPGVSGMAEGASPFVRGATVFETDRLPARAARVLADYLEEAQQDLLVAFTNALEDAAVTRRRRMIARFEAMSPLVDGDSTDLIREARDARG
jgi:hypothetical protein